MILVVGLGNPGKEYENTRHNIGFMVIDKLLDSSFSNASSTKFQGELYKKGSLLLLKPTTYMNLSGNSVKAVNDFYKPERIIVIHDDLDLNFNTIRFKTGGSSGGHNGIKSIDSLIGNDYERVRLGIGNPNKNSVVGHVLSSFSKDEEAKLDAILEYAKKAVLDLIKNDIKETRNKFTTKEIA
ncbi:MAG: aminoacyl-tRNA hydrolase [Campylobacteraceae bacterium]|nr:aminoacyl-tRNA hydrolase [Campylobacteraceae bacterium]